jgi:hypothetical protein
MFSLFDYIYFKVADYYKKNTKDDDYYIMGIVIVSIMQMINLLTIILASSMLIDNVKNALSSGNLEKSKIISFVIVTILLFLNYIRYSKITNYQKLSTKFSNFSNSSSGITIGKTVIVYIILSFVFLVYFAIIYK